MHGSTTTGQQAAWTASSNAPEEVEGIDILDLILALLQAKGRIAACTAVFIAAGLGLSLYLKPVFTATAVIMPPQQEQSSSSALMGQLGALGGLGAGAAASSLGLKNPADMYVGILQSRVIADTLIDRFHLKEEYRQKLRMGARSVLRGNSEFEAAKDGLIYIRVKDHDPKQAAALANAYVDELHSMNSRLAIGQAAQRRLFYDQQLASEKKALAAAEDDLKQTEEKTGLIQLSGQAEMTIRNIADARAQIASREVQLGVARTYATEQNPDVTRLQQEIAALKSQLSILEDAQQRIVPGDVQIPGGRVAAAGLEYMRKLREVRYNESLFELLAKQREAASIDEAKSAPVIQVVDPAEAPELKSGPSRVLIILGLGFLGFLLSSAWAILADIFAGMRPEQAARLRALRDAMGIRKA
jgi:tyrosine-protein kinase Etk/Wzc